MQFIIQATIYYNKKFANQEMSWFTKVSGMHDLENGYV